MAKQAQHKTLIVACGALAKEILHLLEQFNRKADLQCLPAGFHNYPEKITPALEEILDVYASHYESIFIGYGDCGTGGGLDALLKNYPNTIRIPGAHCYAFYAGLRNFENMMKEEIGTFFLTDYLVRHFETLIIKGLGIDRYPNLRETYFKHYKKLTYLAQTQDSSLKIKAQEAALKLGLSFEYRHVGYGNLATAISFLDVETDIERGLGLV